MGKLTGTQVTEIKALLADYRARLGLLPDEPYRTTAALRAEEGVETLAQVGARYGVTAATIWHIDRGFQYTAGGGPRVVRHRETHTRAARLEAEAQAQQQIDTKVRRALYGALEELTAAGLSAAAIGRYFGKSRTWLWWLRARGLVRDTRRERRSDDNGHTDDESGVFLRSLWRPDHGAAAHG